MRWSPAAMALATVLFVTACTGDDNAAPTTATSSTTDVAETTAAPTSSVSPSTVASTTAAPVTDPPSTTTEPAVPPTTANDDPRFAVLDAVEAATKASLAALRDPFNDEKLAALEDHFAGGQLMGWINIVEQYRERNQKQIENPDEPDAFIVELASLAVSVEASSATIQGCEVTSGVIVEIGGNPDGTDRIVEDGIARGVTELTLINVDGTWKVEEARVPPAQEQIASCQ